MIIPSSLFRQARFVAFLLIISFLTSCTTLQLKPLPEPPPSAKLRVFFDAFTIDERQTGKPAPARPPAFFEHSTADFEADQKRIVVQFLEQTDIYEVVQEKDVHEVLGDQWLRFSMLEQNGFSQAREIARALHAEYALFVARILSNEMHGAQGRSIKVVLVNTETGKQYKAVRRLTTFNTFSPGQWKALIRDAYRDLFAQSKEDMLRVALGKGDRMAAQVQPPSTMRLQQEQKA
jgi:dipeptidyl aminopeptidase/acylaminoacyl peptidase